MKKLRLSNIFHWLYAILMLWPFINFVCGMAVYWFSGINLTDVLSLNPWQIFNSECMPDFQGSSGLSYDVCYIWEYLFGHVLEWDTGGEIYAVIVNMLSYWTVVSFVYVAFDLVMFPINLAHRWIDKGGIE